MKKRTLLFEEFTKIDGFRRLVESVEAEAKDIQNDVEQIQKELKDDNIDTDDTEVKAAILLQAIENDGDLENIDLEKVKSEIKESKKSSGQPLNESDSAIILALEQIGSVAGNLDLLHFMCNMIEKTTGKKVDAKQLQEKIQKIVGILKKVSGIPAKALIKFFDWVTTKLGIESIGAKKVVNITGRIMVLTFLFAIGFIHFPVLGSSAIMWVLSLTGLVGKSVEITHLVKEMIKTIKDNPQEFTKKGNLKPSDEEGLVA